MTHLLSSYRRGALLAAVALVAIGCTGSDEDGNKDVAVDQAAAVDGGDSDTGSDGSAAQDVVENADSSLSDALDTTIGPDSADVSTADAPGDATATDGFVGDVGEDILTSDTLDNDGGNPGDAPADTTDAGGKFCPGPDEPEPNAKIADVPKPDTSICKWGDPKFFKGAKPPAQTLVIEIGRVDATGAFQTYKDGDWVALDHGEQGGFHLTAAVRLKLPGVTLPKIKVQFEPETYSGCKLQGYGNAPTVYPVLKDGGWYQVGSKFTAGIQVVFGVPGAIPKSNVSFGYCNEWLDLRAAVRDVKSGKWAQIAVKLRTYDTKAGG